MIIADHLTKYYGDHAAVSDVSLEIAEGEVVGLLGLNGAGKTTILKMLSGLLLPTSGTVSISGVSMGQEPEAARSKIGFLPEVPPVYPEMTVEEYLRFVAHIKGYRGDLDAALERSMVVTNLVTVRGQQIGTLSHGFQRRVGIAQAVVHEPALILLDEPTSGLDPVQVVQMRNLIRGLRGKNTIMVSSHILGEIHEVCDRILVLQDGRIAAEGSEAQLARKVSSTIKMTLEVRAEATALEAALARVQGVVSHSIDADDNGLVAATVELAGDSREELARVVVGAGLGLRRFERVTLELESIFLQLTGGSGSKPAGQEERP